MVDIAIMAGFCLFLAVGGVVAGYWIDSLSMAQAVDAEYEVIEEPDKSKSVQETGN